MGDSLRKGTVVGHQQQALAVLVQAAHRVQAGGDIADQFHNGLAAQLIAGGGHIAAGLVQGQIVELLVLLDVDALVIHMQHIPVGVHLVAHLDGVAVDLDTALGNDLLGRAAGAQALLGHDLLNTFFCHNKTPCAPPGAQKRTPEHALKKLQVGGLQLRRCVEDGRQFPEQVSAGVGPCCRRQ